MSTGLTAKSDLGSFLNGRHVGTRTPDLYRVKVRLILCLARMSSEEDVASLFRSRVNFYRAPDQLLPSREGAGEFGGPRLTSVSLPGARLYI
jgi:hypothetical protein